MERRLLVWPNDVPVHHNAGIKDLILNPKSELYSKRFLQIVVSLTPHSNFKKNLCRVTKRWNVPLAGDPSSPNGREERRGKIIVQCH